MTEAKQDSASGGTSLCTISYVMLDDLSPRDPPVHKQTPRTKAAIKAFVMDIANNYRPSLADRPTSKHDSPGCPSYSDDDKKLAQAWDGKYKDKKHDPSLYFSGFSGMRVDREPLGERQAEIIAKQLLENKYFVRNRLEKYYVVAFALDYATFYVYSKDYDPKVIDWRERDHDSIDGTIKNGELVGPVLTGDDNINPVIALMTAISGKA